MKRYQIISALNYNKALEVVPFAQGVQVMDSDPNNPNQIFQLNDHFDSKSIVCINSGLCLKSGNQKRLEASPSSGSNH